MEDHHAIRFERWTPVAPSGAAYRQNVVVVRGDDIIGEVDALLAYEAGAALVGDIGRHLTEGELREAMCQYTEDEVRRRLNAGEPLEQPVSTIEITTFDRGVLHPYLPTDG